MIGEIISGLYSQNGAEDNYIKEKSLNQALIRGVKVKKQGGAKHVRRFHLPTISSIACSNPSLLLLFGNRSRILSLAFWPLSAGDLNASAIALAVAIASPKGTTKPVSPIAVSMPFRSVPTGMHSQSIASQRALGKPS